MSYTLVIPEELFEQLAEVKRMTGESIAQQIFNAVEWHITTAKEDIYLLTNL
mgnify:CR=1 FL=1